MTGKEKGGDREGGKFYNEVLISGWKDLGEGGIDQRTFSNGRKIPISSLFI